MEYKLFGAGVVRLTDQAFIPADPDNADYQRFLEWQEAGGVPLPERTPEEDLTLARKRAFDELREMRAPMLNAVTGIMVNAIADDETAVVDEAQTIRQKLLDITADAALNQATTYDDMKVAGQLAYRRIAKAASRSFAVVFKEITGA